MLKKFNAQNIRTRLYRTIRTYRYHLVGGLLGIGLLIVLTVPLVSFALGNLFFGEVKVLYNVPLATFFLKCATHPLPLLSTPHYAHYQLGRIYFIEGNLEQALTELQTELSLYPEDTLSYYMIGLTYGYLGQEKKAIDAFTTYIDTHPDTWAARNDKAWLQFRAGDMWGALQTIQWVAHMQPDNPWLANTYGVILMNTGQLKEAKQSFERGQQQVLNMKESDWGYAYPGNDPRVYNLGLASMVTSFKENLALVNQKLQTQKGK